MCLFRRMSGKTHANVCRCQVKPPHNFSFPINILGYHCILVTALYSSQTFSWRFSQPYCHLCHICWFPHSFFSVILQQVILKWFSHDHNSALLFYSGCLCSQFSSPIHQQCKILMKALRNSMLKVVYMTGLTALFRYPSQVTALYSEGEMQQLLQCAFSTWVRKKGNQQMINTPLRQKKEDDQKIKSANHLGCDKMEKNNFCQKYFLHRRV